MFPYMTVRENLEMGCYLRRDKAADGGAKFVPQLIDDASGLGTQVVAADLNGDKAPDVLTASKLGTFVFFTKRK